MIILYILAGIVCFFLLLGLLPLRVRVSYGEELGLTAGIGAITLFRIPSPKNTSVRLRDFTHTRHRKRLARDAARNQKKAKRLAEKAEAKKQKKEQKAQQKEERKTTGHPEDETGLTDKIAEILDLVSLVLEELPRLFELIFDCWLPSSGYRHRGDLIVERYHLWTDDETRRKNRFYEVCLPIETKS